MIFYLRLVKTINPAWWKPTGKRINRGLFRTAKNYLVNADLNGCANILRKVARTLGIDLDGLGKGNCAIR